MNNNIYTLLIYRYYMDFIYEIRLLKEQLKKLNEDYIKYEKKLNSIIVELNKKNHIASYSSDDDIKYPNDSDYD